MKLISWNVNGLRACLGKGFSDYFTQQDADFFCLQETKMQPGQAQIPAPDYVEFFNSAEKKGYSGTAILAKQQPLSVKLGMDSELHDHEGRLITLEYDRFFLVTVYTPNSQRGLTRLMYRMCWEEDFRLYLKKLDAQKPVIVCGDMNVAHQEIDLKNPKTNVNNAGWTAGLWIRSAISTPTRQGATVGGVTCSTPAQTTRGGASTISSFPTASRTRSQTRALTTRFWAATIAPSCWKSTCKAA